MKQWIPADRPAVDLRHQARPGGLSDQDLARALNVGRVLISKAMYNSAKEGQTDVLAACWGKHLWLGVCPETAQLNQVSAGYRVEFEGGTPRKVYKQACFNPPGSTEILVEDEYDQVLTNVGGIYLFKDAIA